MRKGIFLIAGVGTMLVGNPAFAQDTPSPRLKLWRELEYGMTEAEVAALVPEPRIPLDDKCQIAVKPRFKKGKLVSVKTTETAVDAFNSKCGAVVTQAMLIKFGRPDREDVRSPDVECHENDPTVPNAVALACGIFSKDNSFPYREYWWVREGVSIYFSALESSWTTEYSKATTEESLPPSDPRSIAEKL